MTKVRVHGFSMSLDGFIEDASGDVSLVFEWYTAGPVQGARDWPDRGLGPIIARFNTKVASSESLP